MNYLGLYSAFLPALFALAQRAFMRIEMLLLPASLIWPRLRGPAEEVETRRVRPPVRASIAAMTLSRCSVSASMMLGVSICSGIIKQLGFKEHDSKCLSETQTFRIEGMPGKLTRETERNRQEQKAKPRAKGQPQLFTA